MMLENIVRHLDMGKSPLRASLAGSGEVGFTIISMTVSLIAVFIPVLFLQGVGPVKLREFAITISAAIIISGLVSVTLHADALRDLPHRRARPWRRATGFAVPCHREKIFDWMLGFYACAQRWTIRFRLAMLLFSFAFIFGTGTTSTRFRRDSCRAKTPETSTRAPRGRKTCRLRGCSDAQQRVAEIVRQDENVEALSSTVGASGPTVASNAGRLFIRLDTTAQRSSPPTK